MRPRHYMPDPHDGENFLMIDAPSATVRSSLFVSGGDIRRISFTNDLSFSCGLDIPVQVPGYGTVPVDIGYGAAFMVFVQAADLHLTLERKNFTQMLDAAVRCRRAVGRTASAGCPKDAAAQWLLPDPNKHTRKAGKHTGVALLYRVWRRRAV